MAKHTCLGTFELAVMLAVIRLDDNAYGVPISREIERMTEQQVTFGSIYATLTRLEMKGLVSSEHGDPTPERGGRAKKYFHVTANGLREIRLTQRLLKRLWHGLVELEGRRV
jgi:PadR family transcriptional regulator, regulatory protein PadR